MLAVSHTKPLHDAVAQMADDLYGGYAPKQGCFGCLPKVLHDAKLLASNTRHPIFKNYIGFSTGRKSYLFRFYVDGYTTKVYNIYVYLIENSERKD